MATNKLKLATLLAAGVFIGTAPALALDGKVVLDQLVKKGVLTPEEAEAIIRKDAEKQQADPVAPIAEGKQKDVTKLTISGRVQAQAKYFTRNSRSDSTDLGQTDIAGFELRRLNLDFDAELPHGFTAFGSLEVNGGNGGGNNASSAGYAFLIDKAGVAYDSGEYGKFTAGLRKSQFGLEEYTSASNIYTIERSTTSNYFANTLSLGGRHIGLFWETKDNSKDGGPRFGAAVTNSYQGAFNSATTPNGEQYAPAVYANADYVIKFSETSALQLGANFAYTEANLGQIGGLAGSTNTNGNFDTRTYGAELLAKYTAGKFTVLGDFMSAFIENGKSENLTGAEGALPFGGTLTVAYRVTDSIEPLIQLGYTDSDGRGMPDSTFRDFSNDGNSVSPGTGFAAATYDRSASIFAGAAWYITPKSLKFTAGFDAARFKGRAAPNAAGAATAATKQEEDVYGVRMQIQALF